MTTLSLPRLAATAALAGLLAATGCRVRPDPVVVTADQITVSNLTGEPWVEVELSVNRYYRARLPRLDPGGRFEAPLRRFQGGFGRHFDPARERVREVAVTARTPGGGVVRLEWPAASR